MKILYSIIFTGIIFFYGVWLGSEEMPRQEFLRTTYACHQAHMFYTPTVNHFGKLVRVRCVVDPEHPEFDIPKDSE